MKILVYITAHERRTITEFCYRSLMRFINDAKSEFREVEFQVLVCCTEKEDVDLAAKYGFWIYTTENFPLGRKHNKGLEFGIQYIEFDYLLQINSDNILSTDFFRSAYPYLKQGEAFLRFKDLIFLNYYTKQAVRHNYSLGCGIRFIKQKMLKQGATIFKGVANMDFVHPYGYFGHKGRLCELPMALYKQKYIPFIEETYFSFWDDQKNIGLDGNSFVRLAKCFPDINRTPILPSYFVIDIKSEQNIHPFSEFDKGDSFPILESALILKKFPKLKNWIENEI